MVSLERPDGTAAAFHVSKEVRNLPQVKVGDHVTVTYYESLAFAVKKPGTDTPGTTVVAGAARAEPGAKMPWARIMATNAARRISRSMEIPSWSSLDQQ